MTKKTIAFFLCLICLLSTLVSCKSAEKAPQPKEESTEAVGDKSEETTADEQSKKAEDKSSDEKVLRLAMGSTFPWAFVENNELQGFAIDLWDEMGKRMGYTIEYTQYSDAEGIAGALDSGRADLSGGQTAITPAIKDKYNFTDPYAYNLIKMLVKDDNPAQSIEDLHGKKVCIEPGGKLSEFFNAYNDKLPDDEKLELVFTSGSIWEDIQLGRFDSFPITVLSFDARQAKGESLNLKLIGDPIITEHNVFPVAKHVSEDTLKLINKTLNEMLDDGTITKISEKWYDRDITQKFY
ncbi:MAG: transporter substrate-binding domain-containing protein [Eubacteriales bacterium]|nr:transporter substrate-binding domain-containing protein [Clostridiales bacterium]MDY5835650.1 transporter substrate-binding domain-containing protein [Eubacteriales bacterium]